MNKKELIREVSVKAGLSKTKAASAVNTAVKTINAALKKGDRVALVGFGTFTVSRRKARVGSSGATISFGSRKAARFTADRELMRSINKPSASRDEDAFVESLKDLSAFY